MNVIGFCFLKENGIKFFLISMFVLGVVEGDLVVIEVYKLLGGDIAR